MIWFTVSDIISSVDGEVCCVNVVSLYCCFQQFWVVDCSVFFKVQLLILSLNQYLRLCSHRNIWIPQLQCLNHISVDLLQSKSQHYLCHQISSYPESKVCTRMFRTSIRIAHYLKLWEFLPTDWASTLRTFPPFNKKTFLG